MAVVVEMAVPVATVVVDDVPVTVAWRVPIVDSYQVVVAVAERTVVDTCFAAAAGRSIAGRIGSHIRPSYRSHRQGCLGCSRTWW